MAPWVGPVPTMPVSTPGRHVVIMVLVVVLAMMLVMPLVMMLVTMLVAVTMSGIKLRQELGRRWQNWKLLAGHEGCRCWRQSPGGMGVPLPWLRGLGLSRELRQELWRWRWHGEGFLTHDHLRWRGQSHLWGWTRRLSGLLFWACLEYQLADCPHCPLQLADMLRMLQHHLLGQHGLIQNNLVLPIKLGQPPFHIRVFTRGVLHVWPRGFRHALDVWELSTSSNSLPVPRRRAVARVPKLITAAASSAISMRSSTTRWVRWTDGADAAGGWAWWVEGVGVANATLCGLVDRMVMLAVRGGLMERMLHGPRCRTARSPPGMRLGAPSARKK